MTRMGSVLERTDVRIPGIQLPLMSVSQTRGVVRRSELTDKPQRAESLDAYKVCRHGDIVFNKMSVRAGALGLAPEDGLVTYHYEVMRIRDPRQADGRFLVYLMKSDWFIGELIARERGIGAGDSTTSVRTTEVPFKVLRTIDAYLPDAQHQRAIADYLDRETAQIDTLVSKQEALIESLRERRTAVVNAHALASYRPFSDRVGTAPVGSMFSVVLGKMLDAGKEPPADALDLPYIRAANIQDSGLRLDAVNAMPFTPAEASRLDLRKDDLLVVEGGAIGTSVLLSDDMPGWSFQKTVNRVRSTGPASTSWLKYVLLAYRDGGVIDMICTGSTIAHFTAEKLRALRVPLVAPPEQRAIAAYLDEQTAKIDALIAKAQQFIALAKERRAALITAAVTGQIDVTTGKTRAA